VESKLGRGSKVRGLRSEAEAEAEAEVEVEEGCYHKGIKSSRREVESQIGLFNPIFELRSIHVREVAYKQ
jgi:hypothetical protein